MTLYVSNVHNYTLYGAIYVNNMNINTLILICIAKYNMSILH